MTEYLRLIAYIVGTMFSLILFGQMLRLRYWLARLLALAMLGWAVNCSLLLAVLFWFLLTGDSRPAWTGIPFIVNALLMGLIPLLLYIELLRRYGNE